MLELKLPAVCCGTCIHWNELPEKDINPKDKRGYCPVQDTYTNILCVCSHQEGG